MNIVLDSDIIIECLRGNSQIIQKITYFHTENIPLSYTPISLAEIYAGVREKEKTVVKEFFMNLNFVPLSEKIGIKAGEYLKYYAKSHHVEIADALIAATTFTHKAKLFTRTKKHYPMKDIELVH